MLEALEEFKGAQLEARAEADKDKGAVVMAVGAVVMVAAAEELAVETDPAVDVDLAAAADLEVEAALEEEAALEVDVDLAEGAASDLVAAVGPAVVSVQAVVVPEVAGGQAAVEVLEVAARLEADAEDELL